MVNSMSEHPIQGLMGTTMQKIREMVDVNTVVGDPITTPDGTVIIPVSKVGFGFAAGGSDFPSKHPKDLFGGGSGAGITIQPLAFLVICNGEVKILQMDNSKNTGDRMVSMVPEVIDKIAALFGKGEKAEKQKKETAAKPKETAPTEAE